MLRIKLTPRQWVKLTVIVTTAIILALIIWAFIYAIWLYVTGSYAGE